MAESTIQRKITDPEYATQSFSTTVYPSGTTQSLDSTSIDVTKSGYTAVGIISATASTGGSGRVFISEVSLEGNIAHCKRLLPASWQSTTRQWLVGGVTFATVTVTVKYIKNN